MTLSLIPLLLLTAPNLISGQAIPVGAEAGRGPLAAEAIVSRPIGTAHVSEAAMADWNEDGLPDLLMSDITAQHTVYMNRGTRERPRLAQGQPIYHDGLPLHGTWRVKPAVGRLGKRMAYVTLDDDDEFHLYWRVDDFNVTSGGKLRLEDGAPINANFLESGGTGRLKLSFGDWNGDGLPDLLVGTPRHGSVPTPDRGLPQSLGLPGSSVLVLLNNGATGEPRFQWPKLVTFNDEPIFLGQHACGPTPAPFDEDAPADLAVGTEDGRLLFYAREDLGLVSAGLLKDRS